MSARSSGKQRDLRELECLPVTVSRRARSVGSSKSTSSSRSSAIIQVGINSRIQLIRDIRRVGSSGSRRVVSSQTASVGSGSSNTAFRTEISGAVEIRVDSRISLVGNVRGVRTRGVLAEVVVLAKAEILRAVEVGVDSGVKLVGDIGIVRSGGVRSAESSAK